MTVDLFYSIQNRRSNDKKERNITSLCESILEGKLLESHIDFPNKICTVRIDLKELDVQLQIIILSQLLEY
jgi:hypothetical protein